MTEQERILSLEHKVKKINQLLIGGVCLIAGCAILGASSYQTSTDVVRVQTLEVLNDDGKTCAILDGTGLRLLNENGKTSTQMTQTPTGSGVVVTYGSDGEEGKECAYLISGKLRIRNNKGNEIVFLGQDPKENGVLSVNKRSGKGRTTIGFNDWGGQLEILAASGSPTLFAGTGVDGSGLIMTNNRFQRTALMLGSDSQTNAGVIYVENGKQTSTNSSVEGNRVSIGVSGEDTGLIVLSGKSGSKRLIEVKD